jgi:arylsulfatase A-like enzyme
MWFCPGANHAPHHAPQEFIDKYKGAFDDGYEAYREWVLPRVIDRGVLPQGTELSPLNPMSEGTVAPGDLVRPWDTLSDRHHRRGPVHRLRQRRRRHRRLPRRRWLLKVVFDVADDAYVDVARHLAAAMMRD